MVETFSMRVGGSGSSECGRLDLFACHVCVCSPGAGAGSVILLFSLVSKMFCGSVSLSRARYRVLYPL